MTNRLTLNCLWLPNSHGGRTKPPEPGYRCGIRWQRHVAEHLADYRDIQLTDLTFDAATHQGRALGQLVTPVPESWLAAGELVELLEGFRVVAVAVLLPLPEKP